MNVERTLSSNQTGPADFEIDMPYGSIRVTVGGNRPELKLSTADAADSPAGKAIAAAELVSRSGRLCGKVPLPENTGSVVLNSVVGGSIVQFGRSGGVTVTGGGSDVYISGGQVRINGQLVTSSVDVSQGVYAEIALPPGSSLRVQTTSADVVTVGELDKVITRSVSGDVEVNACTELTANSTSGDIAAGYADKANVRTISGDVRLGRTESVIAASTSGDVGINDFGGTANLHTISGDIRVHATEGGNVTASSTSGDVTVTAPADLVATNTLHVAANSLSGRVRTPQAPMQQSMRARSPRPRL